MPEQRYVRFPLGAAGDGTTRTTGLDLYVEGLVEQLLFTAPGERVNRPTLGCGLMELVFDPLSEELGTATRFLVQSALQEWLRGVANIDDVAIDSTPPELLVTVTYEVVATGTRTSVDYRR